MQGAFGHRANGVGGGALGLVLTFQDIGQARAAGGQQAFVGGDGLVAAPLAEQLMAGPVIRPVEPVPPRLDFSWASASSASTLSRTGAEMPPAGVFSEDRGRSRPQDEGALQSEGVVQLRQRGGGQASQGFQTGRIVDLHGTFHRP